MFAAWSDRSGTPRGTNMTRVTHAVLVATLLTVPVLVERAYAHHGAGLYDMSKKVELEGKLTRVEFVNPHTYIYFDVVGNDGKVLTMRCETRGATVLRRSGWSPEMFVQGTTIKVNGPPASRRSGCVHCGHDDAWQYADARALSAVERREIRQSHETHLFRLANGKPNLAGDWAQEQQVLATPPRAGAPGSCRSARPTRSGPANCRCRPEPPAGSRRP